MKRISVNSLCDLFIIDGFQLPPIYFGYPHHLLSRCGWLEDHYPTNLRSPLVAALSLVPLGLQRLQSYLLESLSAALLHFHLH